MNSTVLEESAGRLVMRELLQRATMQASKQSWLDSTYKHSLLEGRLTDTSSLLHFITTYDHLFHSVCEEHGWSSCRRRGCGRLLVVKKVGEFVG